MASKPTDPDGLTAKQRAFVEAYTGPALGNGCAAAKAAGYKGTNAALKNHAYRLTNHPRVQAAILAFGQRRASKAIATREEILETLTAILRDEDEDSKERISAGDKILKVDGAYLIKHELDVKNTSVHVYLPNNGRD